MGDSWGIAVYYWTNLERIIPSHAHACGGTAELIEKESKNIIQRRRLCDLDWYRFCGHRDRSIYLRCLEGQRVVLPCTLNPT
jgi:hypothetical protein